MLKGFGVSQGRVPRLSWDFFFCEWDVGANGVLFRSLFKGEVVLILVGATKGCLIVFLWSNCGTRADSFFKNRERALVIV